MTDVDGIAIVGMAGRFPGARDVDTLWSNLCAGVESVRPTTRQSFVPRASDPSDPGSSTPGAAMDDFEDCSTRVLRDDPSRGGADRPPAPRPARDGVDRSRARRLRARGCGARIGIFGGVAENHYFRYNLLAHPELLSRAGFYPVLIATAREYAITRDRLQAGPDRAGRRVITACSTSAVATHLAVQSLLAGDCDLALAGGPTSSCPAATATSIQEDGILSADGHVRAFDADARGTVMASGVAVVTLKRLADALEDGDTIYAVIRGSAVNNDGAAKVGFTAPSLDGQRDGHRGRPGRGGRGRRQHRACSRPTAPGRPWVTPSRSRR